MCILQPFTRSGLVYIALYFASTITAFLRRSYLEKYHHFECFCAACDVDEVQVEVSFFAIIFKMSQIFLQNLYNILKYWLIAWQLDLQMENRNCAHFRELELRRKKAEVEILWRIIIYFNLHNPYTTMQWKIKKAWAIKNVIIIPPRIVGFWLVGICWLTIIIIITTTTIIIIIISSTSP